MDNYKIKVKDEQDFKEVASLVNMLGYGINFSYSNASGEVVKGLFLKSNGLVEWTHRDTYFDFNDSKELTLPQLRDLVVLKRNDVKDSNCTYRLAAEEKNYAGYLDSNDWMHIFKDGGWQAYVPVVGEELKAFYLNSNAKDPALISGADALRALADDKDVQVSTEFTRSSWHDDTATYTAEEILAEETGETDDYNSMKLFFRLKPQTIKVELELPKPFEPKEGDLYWFITCRTEKGYSCRNHKARHGDSGMQFGAYRTEEEIKQVVEQLRKIRGAS
ncbi:hypothetical protein [Acinetobacter baumannii]|uniref:hypothetical protein n=1 Tax=Acinetobacter baumannii TaxID=470 RepID=UPI0038925C8D